MSRLPLSEALEARSWASWLVWSLWLTARARRSTSARRWLGEIFVAAVVEHLGGHEALLHQRLLHLVLAPRLVGGELGVDDGALVADAGLGERQLLAAHRVDLARHVRLAGEQVEREVRVGEDREQLALLDDGAVLDHHLLDPAALDRVEIDGDERLDPRPQRQEVVERALRRRPRRSAARPPPSGFPRSARTTRRAGRAAAPPPRRGAILICCDRPVEATTLSMPVPLSARLGFSFDLILITLIPTSCGSIQQSSCHERNGDSGRSRADDCPIPDMRLYGGGQGSQRDARAAHGEMGAAVGAGRDRRARGRR